MFQGYAIRAWELTKRYGDLVAVDGISFMVERGEFFGFLGPNGAGKTTTVRMLTGLLSPDSGGAEVLGHNISSESILAKMRVGVVPEMANAYPDLTVWQNLMLMGELYGVHRSSRRKQASDLADLFGLSDKTHARTKTLSKGLRQRLLIAMALVHSPELLFLDEPTSGLDVMSTRMIRELLVTLNREGCTIFLTTHNIEEANQLCGRVAIVREGRIAASGSPHELRGAIQRVQSVEVQIPGRVDSDKLLAITGVGGVKEQGGVFRLLTEDPTSVAMGVVGLASREGWQITSLEIRGPTLEDVFVEITEGGF